MNGWLEVEGQEKGQAVHFVLDPGDQIRAIKRSTVLMVAIMKACTYINVQPLAQKWKMLLRQQMSADLPFAAHRNGFQRDIRQNAVLHSKPKPVRFETHASGSGVFLG